MKTQTPGFATKPINDLLNAVGEGCRELFRMAPRLPPAEAARFRDLIERFDRWHDSVGEAGQPTGYTPAETTWKRVIDIKVGDVLDLEDDDIADPIGEGMQDDNTPNHIVFECEYAVVNYFERETEDCIVLGIEGVDRFGFPPDHLLKFLRHDPEYDQEQT